MGHNWSQSEKKVEVFGKTRQPENLRFWPKPGELDLVQFSQVRQFEAMKTSRRRHELIGLDPVGWTGVGPEASASEV